MPPFNVRTSQCIICGEVNPIGMRLAFATSDRGVSAQLSVSTQWQGYEAIVHGGIVAGMLDDAMWHAIYQKTERWTVTAEMRIRYKRPVEIGQPIWIAGWVDRVDQRLIRAEAEIRQSQPDGIILAAAEGRFMAAPSDLLRESRHSVG